MNWKSAFSLCVVVFLIGVFVGKAMFAETEIKVEDSLVSGVYFSPHGGCEQQVISWIDKANVSIHVLIYSFTLDSVSNALAEAHGRGIQIRVVFEKDNVNQSGSEYQNLKDDGVDVRYDDNSGYMHDKVMIVDGEVVLTGSFNWSSNAENDNNENLIVITSNSVANVYEGEFQAIWNIAN